MKKWSNRILVVVCAVCLVFSILGNISQHNQIVSLKDNTRIQLKNYSEKVENLEEELEKLKSNYEFETSLRESVERDYKVLAEAAFEVAKQKAIEEGFNPNEVDWFLNSQGHWCFWYYPEEDELT